MSENNILEIDIDSLEKEWLRLPMQYMDIAEEAEDLNTELQNSKDDYDTLLAETDQSIRSSAMERGEKITEGGVKAKILIDEKIIQERRNLNESDSQYARKKSLLRAMDFKKRALENLVQLWMGSYFSSPKEKSSHDPEMADQIKQRILSTASNANNAALRKK